MLCICKGGIPQSSVEKLSGIFDDPQIKQFIKDSAFVKSMYEAERKV